MFKISYLVPSGVEKGTETATAESIADTFGPTVNNFLDTDTELITKIRKVYYFLKEQQSPYSDDYKILLKEWYLIFQKSVIASQSMFVRKYHLSSKLDVDTDPKQIFCSSNETVSNFIQSIKCINDKDFVDHVKQTHAKDKIKWTCRRLVFYDMMIQFIDLFELILKK